MFFVTKKFRFEMAHVLSNYDGPCGNLHGHSYVCLVSFSSADVESNTGMVCDFSTIKNFCNELIFDKLDHCCAINIKSNDSFELDLWKTLKKYHRKIYEFPFRTTAENMSRYIFELINRNLKESEFNCVCSKIQLYETLTGDAVYED